jgi:hypothetical protein
MVDRGAFLCITAIIIIIYVEVVYYCLFSSRFFDFFYNSGPHECSLSASRHSALLMFIFEAKRLHARDLDTSSDCEYNCRA